MFSILPSELIRCTDSYGQSLPKIGGLSLSSNGILSDLNSEILK